MNLESHPYIHFALILTCYNFGMFGGVLSVAYIASKSSLNSFQNIRDYLKARWIPLGLRWMLCLFAFFMVWDNTSVINIEKFMTTFLAHMGGAGLLGFASDQVFDKVLAIILPSVQKELPPIP